MLIFPTPRRLHHIAMAFALCAATATAVDAADPKPKPTLAIDFANPAHLGNIYLTTEPVVLPIAVAQGDRIAWKISDLWGTQLAEGTSAVSGGTASIAPPFTKKGYFLVEVTLPDHTTAYTSFAVITPPGPLSAESPFGVVGGGELLPVIAKAGISSTRVEHCWTGIEKEKGIFTYPEKWQRAMDDCKPFGINPVLSQYWGHPLYTGTWVSPPRTPEAREAFGRYGQELLKHYGTQLKHVEVWNEFNGTWCGDGQVVGKNQRAGRIPGDQRAEVYADMMKVNYPMLKAIRPDIQVGGCACVGIPLPYIEGIFKNGGLPFMDAIIIHPYRVLPEGVDDDIARLRDLIRQYNNGQDKAIWATEVGRVALDEYPWEKGRKMYEKGRRFSAAYLARLYTLLLSRHVEMIHWFGVADWPGFESMGLMRDQNSPMGPYAVAPAYVAYATLIRQLTGVAFVKREPLSKFTYVYHFTRGAEEIRVCWATKPAHIAITTTTPMHVVDVMGEEQTLTPVNGAVCLTLTDYPYYVIGKASGVIKGGQFNIPAEQDIDLTDEYAISYAAAPGLSGQLNIQGKPYPVGAGKGGRAVLAGKDTHAIGSDLLWYTLSLNGKLNGIGGIVMNVVDPVSFRDALQAGDNTHVTVRLANESKRVGYTVNSITWKVGALTGTQQAVNTPLPTSTGLTLTMPSTDIPLYKPLPADVQVTFDGRPPLSDSWEMSNNPCPKKTIRADGDLADWQGVTPIDLATCGRKRGKTGVKGTVMMAWDDANFYLAAKVTGGEILQFALAPTYSGRWSTTPNLRGWYEFAAQPGKPLTCLMSPNNPKPGPIPEATGMATKGGADAVYEIAIPWKKLAPITPSAGHVKLSVFVQDSADTVGTGIEWGGGIAVGKSPDAFRLCRFDGGQGGKKEPGNVSEAINRVTPTPDSEQVLADSEIDFGIEQGFKNWSYGYYDGKGGGEGDAVSPMGPYTDDDFKPMHIETDIWGTFWQGPFKNFNLGPSNAHPTVYGRQYWAVRRWKSTYDGIVHITGKAYRHKQGDGVEARILIDGVAVYNDYVGGPLDHDLQEHDIDCTAPVAIGSLIDFALTPGKGLDASYDATPYKVRISASAAKKR